MDAGQLDRRIQLLSKSKTRDAAGQPIDDWTSAGTIYAAQYPLLAKEINAQAGRDDQAEQKFLVRWRQGVTTSQRVLDGAGQGWAITGIQEMGRREGLWLFVTAINGPLPVSVASNTMSDAVIIAGAM